jgi:hypothetical protein
MDLIEGSETSANINQTLGIHPKIETVNTEHSESLKSRIIGFYNREEKCCKAVCAQSFKG